MWKYFLNNPAGRNVGDCAVRAVSLALNMDWKTAYFELVSQGFYLADLPSSNATINATLMWHGFERDTIPNTCPDCYTVEDFCKEHPTGVYVLGTGSHVVTVIDGDYWDSWDSGNEIPIYFWHKVYDSRDNDY